MQKILLEKCCAEIKAKEINRFIWLKPKKENFINEKRPHESGIKHVSGRAFYTDDIPEPPGTLFGAIGWSKKAHAIIKKINLDRSN